MMHTRQLVLIGICALAAAGCSGLRDTQSSAWKVEPDSAVRHGGMDAESMYLIGRHFHNQGRYELAVTAYRDALNTAQGDLAARVRNALAVTYAAQGRYNAAIAELQDAVGIDPKAVYLQSNLGYAYLLRGDNDKALQTLQEAARLDPAHERTQRYLRMAQSRVSGGTPQQSVTAVAPSKAQTPTAATPTVEQARASSEPAQRTARDPHITLDAVSPGVYELREPARTVTPPVTIIVPTQAAASEHKPFRLEVANGNGVGGLARRVAERLKTLGVATVRLTNQVPPSRITEVQYAQGYAAEAAQLAGTLNQHALMVASSKLRKDINVRLVIGGDARSVVALFEPASHRSEMMAALTGAAPR